MSSVSGRDPGPMSPAALVGRSVERSRLRELIAAAGSGHGVSVLVEGESGIGKTSLMDVLAEDCRSAGFRVLHGRAEALEQRVLLQAIRSCFDSAQPAESAAPAALPGGGGGLTSGVTEAILDVLDRWCTAGPVALLLDDLHWADDSSVAVLDSLHRVLPQLPMLVCACAQPEARTVGPAPAWSSLRDRWPLTLPLMPLEADEVAELVARLVGARPAPALLEQVAAAAGNPLFVTETVTALAQRGGLLVADGVSDCVVQPGAASVTASPGYVKEAILRRLDRLPSQTQEMLRVAAAMGPRVHLSDLSTVLDVPVIKLWEPVGEALRAGLLVDPGDRLAFRHGLIHQALVESIPPAPRAALQTQASLRLARSGAPPERVAEYLQGASFPLDAELVDCLVQASPALVLRAPALAVDVLGQALGTVRTGEPPYGALCVHMARALLRTQEPVRAEAVARQALAAGCSGEEAWELRWLLAQSLYRRRRLQQTAQEGTSVLATLSADPRRAARFHALVAQCHYLLGDHEAAEESARQAVAAGERAGDAYCVAYGLTLAAIVGLLRGRPVQALELTDRALAALGNQEIRTDLQTAPHIVRGFVLIHLDRSAEARLALDRGLDDCDRGADSFLTWYHLGRSFLHFDEGHWDDALAEIDTGLETVDSFGLGQALRSQAALIAVHRGDPHTYADSVRQPDSGLSASHFVSLRRWARALTWEAQGESERALDLLFTSWEQGVKNRADGSPYRITPDIVRIAADVGDTDRLRRVADAPAFLPAGRRSVSVDAARTLTSGLAGSDPELLVQAAAAYRSLGRPLYEAYAQEGAASAFAALDRTDAARSALQAAVSLYRELGAAWDADRAETRMAGAGIRLRRRARGGARTGWAGLTETERAIARHVAQGRSNPDIGASMFLSPRTVQFHLSAVFTKLGITSRVELAVIAHQYDELP